MRKSPRKENNNNNKKFKIEDKRLKKVRRPIQEAQHLNNRRSQQKQRRTCVRDLPHKHAPDLDSTSLQTEVPPMPSTINGRERKSPGPVDKAQSHEIPGHQE